VGEAPRPQDLLARILPAVAARHREAWLVGGWVRDRLLGVDSHDIDLVVPTGAVATARHLADLVGGAFVLLDETRDTARVVVGAPGDAIYLDLAGMRGPGIEADLMARDFTVNAMALAAAAYCEPEPTIIDPSGGRRDLAARRLRAVSPGAFRDDPLRTLRGVRLGAALGFDLDDETAAWMRQDAALLSTVSRERVRDELMQMLALPRAERSLRRLDGLGLLEQVLPELAALRQVEARYGGEVSALDRSLRTVGIAQEMLDWLAGTASALPGVAAATLQALVDPYRARLVQYLGELLPGGRSKATLLLLATSLHEVGKGATEQGHAGAGGRFLDHEVLGASMAATIGRRLCLSSAETARLRLAVRNHSRPWELAREAEAAPSRRAMYRFFRDAEPAGVEAILLSLAHHLATYGSNLDPERWRRHVAASAALLEACFDRREEIVDPRPLIDGHGLIETLDLVPGPGVGVLLDGIREAQAAGEVHSREEALTVARHLLEREGLR